MSIGASTTLDKLISEADFKKKIVDEAKRQGWLVFHPVKGNRDKRWYTASQGDVGYPDLTLARGGRVIFLELKRHGRYATVAQERWLSELSGVEWARDKAFVADFTFCGDIVVGCVHPKDWSNIESLLQ